MKTDLVQFFIKSNIGHAYVSDNICKKNSIMVSKWALLLYLILICFLRHT